MTRSDRNVASRALPSRPSLESLKKRAKALLRAFRSGDATAQSRVAAHLPDPAAFTSLRDAQRVIAREYGLADWAALREAVESAVLAGQSLAAAARAFLDHACVTYDATRDSPRRWVRAARMLEQRPEIAGADVFSAAACGDVIALTRLLAVDPECVGRPGGPHDWPPLLYLCYGRIPDDGAGRDPLAAAKLLLDHGADANAHFELAHTYRFAALTGAIGDGEGRLVNNPRHPHARELAILLLEAGADPNDAQAVYNTHFDPGSEWLELLLAYGLTADARVDWTDPMSPPEPMRTLDWLLGRDVVAGFEDRMVVLLAHGADPNSRDYYNRRTPYENALLYGRPELAELLVHHGAEPVALSEPDRFRAACMRADEETARRMVAEHPHLIEDNALMKDAIRYSPDSGALLFELGADASRANDAGMTPLHHAAFWGKHALCERLLEAGARLDLRDTTYDGTPVGHANQSGHTALRDWLLDRTRDVFDLAVWGRAEQLRAVLAADPTCAARRRARGATPLHCIFIGGDLGAELIDLLCAHGGDVNARTESGATPLDEALARDAEDVAELLRARGGRSG